LTPIGQKRDAGDIKKKISNKQLGVCRVWVEGVGGSAGGGFVVRLLFGIFWGDKIGGQGAPFPERGKTLQKRKSGDQFVKKQKEHRGNCHKNSNHP